MLVSVGERISCALAAMAIHDLGHQAISLTGSQAGIVTDTVHGKARIVEVRARRVHEAIDPDRIVLVAGFQGVSTAHEVTTLGRGGSDMTAVALASALGADACEIYTDVDGVFTADPRVVPAARKLHAVSYEEMLEMAASGAQVLQLRSVEFARNHEVKVHVRSTFSKDDGTWIREEDEGMLERAMIAGVTHTSEESVYTADGIERRPAVRCARGRQRERGHDRAHRLGHRLLGPRLDHERDRGDARAPRRRDWSVREDLGKVSVIGAGMKSHPGIAARTFATLAELGIEDARRHHLTHQDRLLRGARRRSSERFAALQQHLRARHPAGGAASMPRVGIVGATRGP